MTKKINLVPVALFPLYGLFLPRDWGKNPIMTRILKLSDMVLNFSASLSIITII